MDDPVTADLLVAAVALAVAWLEFFAWALERRRRIRAEVMCDIAEKSVAAALVAVRDIEAQMAEHLPPAQVFDLSRYRRPHP